MYVDNNIKYSVSIIVDSSWDMRKFLFHIFALILNSFAAFFSTLVALNIMSFFAFSFEFTFVWKLCSDCNRKVSQKNPPHFGRFLFASASSSHLFTPRQHAITVSFKIINKLLNLVCESIKWHWNKEST